MRVPLALDQQVERVQDRESRLDQRQELLVINQKRAVLELAPPAEGKPTRKQSLGLYPVNQIALCGKTVAYLGHRVALLDLLVRVATLVREFDDEFCHFPVLFAAFRARYLLGSV